MLDATDMLAALAEAHGVKPAVVLRSSLQQMCKATLDAMHAKSLGKLTSGWQREHSGARCRLSAQCRCSLVGSRGLLCGSWARVSCLRSTARPKH